MTLTTEHEQAANMAKEIFDRISDLLNTLSNETWNTPELQADPEKRDREKHVWGKGVLCALAQQLGIIEAALILSDGLDGETTLGVREMWIRAGHRICTEALEAKRVEDAEN